MTENAFVAVAKKHEVYTGLLIVSLVAIASFWFALFANLIFPTWDLETHYRWVTQFIAALDEGVWHPRWASESNLGLGDPTFVYYPPAYYYVVSIVDAWLNNTWLSMRVTSTVANAGTGLLAFLFVRRIAPWRYAVIAAVCAQTLPFGLFLWSHHNALPWHFSLVPLTMMVGFSVVSPRLRAFDPWLSVSVALLTVSHVLVAFMALICVGFGVLARSWAVPTRERLKLVLNWASACGLGLLLAAPYLFPALTAQHLISPGEWFRSHALDWHNSFVLPLVTSGIFGTRWFSMQWILPSVLLVGLVSVGWSLWILRTARTNLWYCTWALFVTATAGFLLSSEVAYPLYATVDALQRIQWPYRFLTLASICLALAVPAAAAMLHGVRRSGLPRLMNGLWVVASIGLFLTIQFQIYTAGKDANLGPQTLTGDFGRAEYGVPYEKPHWRAYAAGGLEKECAAAGAQCDVLVQENHRKSWRIASERPVELRLPVFAFPAWEVYVDAEPSQWQVDSETALISVRIPRGTHTVDLKWEALQHEKVGYALGVLAGLMLFVSAWFRFQARRSARDI